MKNVGSVQIEVSPAELIDKITILTIKSKRIGDSAKLENVQRELQLLQEIWESHVEWSSQLSRFAKELQLVNERLWVIEDEIRDHEASLDFGTKFVELARSVYKENDRRAEIKKEINDFLGSKITEEKSYNHY